MAVAANSDMAVAGVLARHEWPHRRHGHERADAAGHPLPMLGRQRRLLSPIIAVRR
jgi:hypothetical protein